MLYIYICIYIYIYIYICVMGAPMCHMAKLISLIDQMQLQEKLHLIDLDKSTFTSQTSTNTTITIGLTLLGAIKRCTSQNTPVLRHMQITRNTRIPIFTRFKLRAISFVIITNLSYQSRQNFAYVTHVYQMCSRVH